MTSSWNFNAIPDQSGRVAIVTGASSGLGYEVALALAGKGATVVLACRNPSRAMAAKAQIIARYPRSPIAFRLLDTSDMASVRQFAQEFLATYRRCDLLINNAGIMMTPYRQTGDGFESQLATNYLGHYLLTSLLLPTMIKTPGARVVSVSSLAHHWTGIRFDDINFSRQYSARLAYGQSKAACLMFAFELQRRLQAGGHDTLSVAAHPGLAMTELGRDLPLPLRLLWRWLGPHLSQSAAAGAQPLLYAALQPGLQGGAYIGPEGKKEHQGRPVAVGCADVIRDRVAAARLWQISEQMTGARWHHDPHVPDVQLAGATSA